jgi:hypothetical protein
VAPKAKIENRNGKRGELAPLFLLAMLAGLKPSGYMGKIPQGLKLVFFAG